jgi:protein-S-isoprenylcysteine O-methyltransferase Ste14
VYSLAITPMQFDPRHLEILGRLAEPAMILLGGSLVYGLYAAVDARQIGNSNTLPDKLKTDGVHRYHRNPYVAGTDLAAMLASGAAIFTNMMSTNPRPFLAAALAAATSAFVWFRHRAVVREERTLERLFDVRYRTYLNSTTRYVPDVVKMIEDFRNWLLGKNA